MAWLESRISSLIELFQSLVIDPLQEDHTEEEEGAEGRDSHLHDPRPPLKSLHFIRVGLWQRALCYGPLKRKRRQACDQLLCGSNYGLCASLQKKGLKTALSSLSNVSG